MARGWSQPSDSDWTQELSPAAVSLLGITTNYSGHRLELHVLERAVIMELITTACQLRGRNHMNTTRRQKAPQTAADGLMQEHKNRSFRWTFHFLATKKQDEESFRLGMIVVFRFSCWFTL